MAIKKLNANELGLLTDRILAIHFSILKYMEAFRKIEVDRERFLYTDSFSLKNFLQQFNVIRHIKKDEKNIENSNRNLIRLANVLSKSKYTYDNVDKIALVLERKTISRVNAISMTSKILFLANPQEIFIYDRFVKKSIGFKNEKVNYNQFYERIFKITSDRLFQEYILEIENILEEKLRLIENWANYKNGCVAIRRMRLTDSYLMFLGMQGVSIY
jgi:hypothetical protein